jgi:hypothetical protein
VSFEFTDYDTEQGGVGALGLFRMSLCFGIADKGAGREQYHEA